MDRVRAAFTAAARQGRAALLGYLTGGYPSPEQFGSCAEQLLRQVDLLEVGLPYSDPLGDGPVIQASSQQALERGATLELLLGEVAALRAQFSVPIALMTYYNPIWSRGEEQFVQLCLAAGVDGLVLPDLPADEASSLIQVAGARGLALTFLAAPTSTSARIELAARASSGFLYLVSVTGVTGMRSREALSEVPGMIERVRRCSSVPLAVGFGISDPEAAAQLSQLADGIVVGSAIVEAARRGEDLGNFAAALRAATTRYPSV